MTGRDLLMELSFIEGRFVDEAETADIPAREGRIGSGGRLSVKKGLLIAAVITVMLTLVGCAVAYVMHRKDFQVGQQEATKPVYGENGWSIEGYEPITEQVLTLSGLEGSSNFLAAQEWYDFLKCYDPDNQLLVKLGEEGEIQEFPGEYDAYNIYTQEMRDKLDEIVKTYDLKLAGEELPFPTEKSLYNALGLETLLTTEDGVTVAGNGGGCYENGNFRLTLSLEVPADEESQMETTSGVLQWSRKDCFSESLVTIEETDDWEEWNYTCASGRTALILRSHTDSRGWIIWDRGDGILSLQVSVRRDTGYSDEERQWWEYQFMSNRQLELLAQAIDGSVEPKLVSQENVEIQDTSAATQNGYTVRLKSIETDGWDAYITLAITAPEGTVISRSTRPGEEDLPIEPHNDDFLVSGTGETVYFATSWSPQEDGDGKDNTNEIVLLASGATEDGEAPFALGSTWTLKMENLTTYYFDPETYNDYTETLAEGLWEFPITIGEANGDFREVEVAEKPVKLQGSVGMNPDGSYRYEDVAITSFRLHHFGAMLTQERYTSFHGSFYAVMKDGSRTELSSAWGGGNTQYLRAKTPLELDQVASVLLPDGMTLSLPEQSK